MDVVCDGLGLHHVHGINSCDHNAPSYASSQEELNATQEFLEPFGFWHQPGLTTR